MATSTSRSWTFRQTNHRETWSSPLWHSKPAGVGGSLNYGFRENNIQRMIPFPVPLGHEISGRKRGYLGLGLGQAKGCKWEEVQTASDRPAKIGRNDPYEISEEDKRFIDEFREAYPYIFSHRGRTFVVVISGDIVASSRLHGLLKSLWPSKGSYDKYGKTIG